MGILGQIPQPGFKSKQMIKYCELFVTVNFRPQVLGYPEGINASHIIRRTDHLVIKVNIVGNNEIT